MIFLNKKYKKLLKNNKIINQLLIKQQKTKSKIFVKNCKEYALYIQKCLTKHE